MVNVVGVQKTKNNPHFRTLVTTYCNSTHYQIDKESQEQLIEIRNDIFHEEAKKTIIDATQIEEFIKDFSRKIDCTLENKNKQDKKQKERKGRANNTQPLNRIDYTQLIKNYSITIKKENR